MNSDAEEGSLKPVEVPNLPNPSFSVSNLEHCVFCRARGRGRGRGKRRFGPGRRPGRPPKFMRLEVTSENGEKCEEGTQVYFGGWMERKENQNHGWGL